jgi:hypothetical protein
MSEQKYYVLTVQSGYSLRQHGFEKAPNGTYLFTEDEAIRMFDRRQGFLPVAVRKENLESMIEQIKAEQAKK